MGRLDHLQSVKFLRLDISFSQGDEWKALISKYIGIIPVSGDACAAAEQRISVWPPKTSVSRAMIAKVGAAPRHSQSVARRAVASPISERIAAPMPGAPSSGAHLILAAAAKRQLQ
jgi:hypothetical protein